MIDRGRILLADDEETFLHSTADLLRREGYVCDTVSDGDQAIERIGNATFDLLISDLEMPGNVDLHLVRTIAENNGGLPVIILTGYPSVRSAVACIELPVAAYLTKPVAFPLLLEKTSAAVKRYRSYQTLHQTETRLKNWQKDFAHVVKAGASGSTPIDVFLALTLRNVMGSLTDLEQLSRVLNQQPPTSQPCQLLNCPRGGQLIEAVRETIRVLEETKGSFKSKILGDLRRRLELLLEHV